MRSFEILHTKLDSALADYSLMQSVPIILEQIWADLTRREVPKKVLRPRSGYLNVPLIHRVRT